MELRCPRCAADGAGSETVATAEARIDRKCPRCGSMMEQIFRGDQSDGDFATLDRLIKIEIDLADQSDGAAPARTESSDKIDPGTEKIDIRFDSEFLVDRTSESMMPEAQLDSPVSFDEPSEAGGDHELESESILNEEIDAILATANYDGRDQERVKETALSRPEIEVEVARDDDILNLLADMSSEHEALLQSAVGAPEEIFAPESLPIDEIAVGSKEPVGSKSDEATMIEIDPDARSRPADERIETIDYAPKRENRRERHRLPHRGVESQYDIDDLSEEFSSTDMSEDDIPEILTVQNSIDPPESPKKGSIANGSTRPARPGPGEPLSSGAKTNQDLKIPVRSAMAEIEEIGLALALFALTLALLAIVGGYLFFVRSGAPGKFHGAPIPLVGERVESSSRALILVDLHLTLNIDGEPTELIPIEASLSFDAPSNAERADARRNELSGAIARGIDAYFTSQGEPEPTGPKGSMEEYLLERLMREGRFEGIEAITIKLKNR